LPQPINAAHPPFTPFVVETTTVNLLHKCKVLHTITRKISAIIITKPIIILLAHNYNYCCCDTTSAVTRTSTSIFVTRPLFRRSNIRTRVNSRTFASTDRQSQVNTSKVLLYFAILSTHEQKNRNLQIFPTRIRIHCFGQHSHTHSCYTHHPPTFVPLILGSFRLSPTR